MRRRSVIVSMLVVLSVALGGVVGVGRADARRHVRCGFYPVLFRAITERQHISCAQAKRVLLRLRGQRDTVPMICGTPSRDVHGWHLVHGERAWELVTNRYSRGRASFVYSRMQNPYREYCPPKYPSSEHV
jgi:hypothetical protein